MDTYKIVRFYFKGGRRTIKRGLSLEEARAHCKNSKTKKVNSKGLTVWFDGYEKE